MSRYEVCGVRESATNHSSGSGKDCRCVRFAIIHSSRTASVNVCIERRDNRIVERECDIEKPLHGPCEREDAISVYLQPGKVISLALTSVFSFS